MHLMATDPATSPRSLHRRIAFGALYGAGVVAPYALPGAAHTDACHDKLLPVPVLNLLVRRLDRALAADIAPTGTAATVAGLPLRHVVMTGSWAATFVVLTLTGQLSDNHPGGAFRSGATPATPTAATRARTCRAWSSPVADGARAGPATRSARRWRRAGCSSAAATASSATSRAPARSVTAPASRGAATHVIHCHRPARIGRLRDLPEPFGAFWR